MEAFSQRKKEQMEFQEMRWNKWKEEQEEAKKKSEELRKFWEKKREEERNKQRDKDFADAIYKIGRAGYQGKFGNYEVPMEMKNQLDAFRKQAEHGDKDNTDSYDPEWQKLRGMSKVEAQREFIKLANKVLTRYGWNPPEGWI